MDFSNITNDKPKNDVIQYLIDFIASDSVYLKSITVQQETKEVGIIPYVKETRLNGDFTIIIKCHDRRLT